MRPKVYIAVGVSGTIQHVVGMKEAESIIAINKNSKESIFRMLDGECASMKFSGVDSGS